MGEMILQWIADYCAGRLDEETGRKLRSWIDEAPGNREVFEKYVRLVKMHRMIEGEQMICDREAWTKLYGRLRHNRNRRVIGYVVSAAASVLIIMGVGIGILWKEQASKPVYPIAQILPGTTKATLVLANGAQIDLTRNDLKEVTEQGALIKNDTLIGLQYDRNALKVEEPVFHTVKVPVAGEYHFTLSDGTKVWINSDSEVTFPVSFVGNSREVYVKGEAYFEVEHDEEHPFIVHANAVDIRVLGTKFNVAAYEEDEQVVTTLTQGAVEVGFAGMNEHLQPGYQAIADIHSQTIGQRQVETGMYVSWIKGIFEYENMPLSEIAVQLSRWYDVNFIFSAPEFKDRRFTGVVKKYDMLNDVLKIIEKTTNVSFMINGKDIAVKSVVK